jgi:hypothetical protein
MAGCVKLSFSENEGSVAFAAQSLGQVWPFSMKLHTPSPQLLEMSLSMQ